MPSGFADDILFGLISDRLSDVIAIVEEVASDLGTPREVVRRILKDPVGWCPAYTHINFSTKK